MKLGLLFGEDVDATTTDLPEVLSFQHKLIQEYLAAVYITEMLTENTSEFLSDILPNWEKIACHKEVVQFACGMLAKTDASPLTNYVAEVLGKQIQKEIDEGEDILKQSLSRSDLLSEKSMPTSLDLLNTFQREGNVPLDTPYLSFYPKCGRPLSEVLATTRLAVITGIDVKDRLDLKANNAQIILLPMSISRKMFDKMWQALHALPVTNVEALYLSTVKNVNRKHFLKHFPQLKYLYIPDADVLELEDLALSIESWGPQPQLTYCYIRGAWPKIPSALVRALSRCTQLRYLDLSDLHLHEKLSILMASPPPALRQLILSGGNLYADDIGHITQAVRQDKLTQLQELNIRSNLVGEMALTSMLEAITIKPHSLKHINLGYCGVNGEGRLSQLSDEFVDKWKTKLTNIEFKW